MGYRVIFMLICSLKPFFSQLQWFNLNSLLMGPELISDTYLALFLAQLQQEGNSNLQMLNLIN